MTIRGKPIKVAEIQIFCVVALPLVGVFMKGSRSVEKKKLFIKRVETRKLVDFFQSFFSELF